MYVIMSISGGKIFEGVVLAAGGNRMRIALRDDPDTVELIKTDGQWSLNDGTLVELEFVICSAGLCSSLLSSSPGHAPLQAA